MELSRFIGKKYVKYIKLFEIQGTGYYDINVTCTGSQKHGLLEFIKFKFRHIYSFPAFEKEIVKFSVKKS